jgi:hypothetical protein
MPDLPRGVVLGIEIDRKTINKRSDQSRPGAEVDRDHGERGGWRVSRPSWRSARVTLIGAADRAERVRAIPAEPSGGSGSAASP